MRLKFVKEEDFVNYKKSSMFLGTCFCDFKCCKEAGIPETICQNEPWSKEPVREFEDEKLIQTYLENPITSAIVFGGMEPWKQFDEMFNFIKKFREKSDDDVVIYTGYYENEILEDVEKLKQFKNIIIKYGRFVLNDESRFDEVLGITLASKNQFAVKIS